MTKQKEVLLEPFRFRTRGPRNPVPISDAFEFGTSMDRPGKHQKRTPKCAKFEAKIVPEGSQGRPRPPPVLDLVL